MKGTVVSSVPCLRFQLEFQFCMLTIILADVEKSSPLIREKITARALTTSLIVLLDMYAEDEGLNGQGQVEGKSSASEIRDVVIAKVEE